MSAPHGCHFAKRRSSALVGLVVILMICIGLHAMQRDEDHEDRSAFVDTSFQRSRSGNPALRSQRPTHLTTRHASDDAQDPDRSWDLLAGRSFLRKTSLFFESETPFLTQLLFLTALFATSGLFGLFYNGLGTLALLASPDAKPAMDDATTIALEVAGAIGGSVGFWALNVRRTQVLERLDSELELATLEYEPSTGIGVTQSLDDARQKRRKVLALIGDGADFAVRAASVYRRRWASSDVQLICVGPSVPRDVAGPWVAEAKNPEAWKEANAKLRSASGARALKGTGELSWVLIGRGGRVQGKGGGIGEGIPDFDELLSFAGLEGDLANLPEFAPTSSSEDEAMKTARKEILDVHEAFYKALTDGDPKGMQTLFMDTGKDVLSGAQRVPWDKVLSAPSDLIRTVDADVVFTNEELDEAAITTIEVCPGPPSLFNEGGPGGLGTLLATKRLRLGEDKKWKLISHRTIPYCSNTLSTSALRCNCKGCVLLKPGG
mmetsp:Transcript_13349/g.31280  ORF Transcript_13349/g.31280 Transcript_13349/m.31280 type:complete len:492 (+) Transcript_13349:97-1572(+)|eukprot:CAMPEP_0178444210 /NCGR_PEP_ID=MMETSP0689_2-20121128/39359_1 /TAXON_ID=160604 /ORGANISM="Amphidinium massartii, Strain CS-259" /LENGTH=491 /DNA_ID=CAMNT_0020068373 /DNA_START=76 /DNA_END=1551 /DNA_ORIENTATION=+